MATDVDVKIPQQSEMAPDFALRSANDRELRISDFRGQRSLVLAFISHGEDAHEWLRALAARTGELQEEEALLLVVVRGGVAAAEALRQREQLPFPVLADSDGRIHERYGVSTRPAVYLTDRYGEIYDVYREQLPAADDVIASLRHINAACPE